MQLLKAVMKEFSEVAKGSVTDADLSRAKLVLIYPIPGVWSLWLSLLWFFEGDVMCIPPWLQKPIEGQLSDEL